MKLFAAIFSRIPHQSVAPPPRRTKFKNTNFKSFYVWKHHGYVAEFYKLIINNRLVNFDFFVDGPRFEWSGRRSAAGHDQFTATTFHPLDSEDHV